MVVTQCHLLPVVSSQSPSLKLTSSKATDPQSQIFLQLLMKTSWMAESHK